MTMLIILALYNAVAMWMLVAIFSDAVTRRDRELLATSTLAVAGSFATTFYFLTEILS